MRFLSSRAIPAAVAVTLAAGLAPAAHAGSTNVVAAIKTQDKVIHHSAGWKDVQRKAKPKTKAQLRRYAADLGKLEKVAAHSVDIVAGSSTSSAKQREGKRDWVRGSREQDRAILELQTAVKAALRGDKTAFKRDYIKGIKTLVAGTKLGIKGDKLLGLPITD